LWRTLEVWSVTLSVTSSVRAATWWSACAAVRSANAVALSMFGYNKRDMVNQNVSMIVPQPMSGIHDRYLQKFVESGRSVGVLAPHCGGSRL
jgi:hypothetical protein